MATRIVGAGGANSEVRALKVTQSPVARRPAARRQRRWLALVLIACLAWGQAASAPPVSAQPSSASVATGSLEVVGHGYGHGRGMGQYGALGYAVDEGWSSAQILAHFYGGTTAASVSATQTMTVRIMSHDARPLLAQVDSGQIATFVTGGTPVVPTDQAYRAVKIESVSGGFRVSDAATCAGPWTVRSGTVATNVLRVRPTTPSGLVGDDVALGQTVQLCHAAASGGYSASPGSSRFYRGELRAVRTADPALPGAYVTRAVNALGLDSYVRGVVPRESPASWGTIDCASGALDCGRQALQAQAVAARSYSLGENRYAYAKTCDTTSCQVYVGRASRADGGAIVLNEAATTDAAVAATPSLVRKMGDGSIARTEFSSSTGGRTAGGTFPSVADTGDDVTLNPYHSWSVVLPASSLQAKYGLGDLQAAAVTARTASDGGRRVASLRLDFAGGSVTRTGDQFRQEWGLRSTWFEFPTAPRLETVGVHRGPEWFLRDTNSAGQPTTTFNFGVAGDRGLVGDWNADGVDTPAVRRGATWHLRNSNSSGGANVSFSYGVASDVPVAGDWDGNISDTPGVRRGNVWYLRNSSSSGGANVSFSFGAASDVPVVGDWDGNRTVTVGVFRSGTFFLRNANSGGAVSTTIATGITGVPIAGDWDGDGDDEVGVRTGNTFTLYLTDDPAGAKRIFSFGATTDRPLAGRWL